MLIIIFSYCSFTILKFRYRQFVDNKINDFNFLMKTLLLFWHFWNISFGCTKVAWCGTIMSHNCAILASVSTCLLIRFSGACRLNNLFTLGLRNKIFSAFSTGSWGTFTTSSEYEIWELDMNISLLLTKKFISIIGLYYFLPSDIANSATIKAKRKAMERQAPFIF